MLHTISIIYLGVCLSIGRAGPKLVYDRMT